MNLVYHSLTGNTKRIAERLESATGLKAYPIGLAPENEPYLLLTHTFFQGGIPIPTLKFLGLHWKNMRGVVSSGAYQWGEDFGKAADLISEKFGVPVVAKVNKSGNQEDLDQIIRWLQEQ